jgi:hypothetical protein
MSPSASSDKHTEHVCSAHPSADRYVHSSATAGVGAGAGADGCANSMSAATVGCCLRSPIPSDPAGVAQHTPQANDDEQDGDAKQHSHTYSHARREAGIVPLQLLLPPVAR